MEDDIDHDDHEREHIKIITGIYSLVGAKVLRESAPMRIKQIY